MAKLIDERLNKIGHPPGTLVHVGEKRTHKIRFTLFEYNDIKYHETEAFDVGEFLPVEEKQNVLWYHIEGIHDANIIKKIGESFNIHPLMQEDIIQTDQRPKCEEFSEYLFISLKAISMGSDEKEIIIEQISLIIGKNFVVSFQETDKDIFKPIKDRIRDNKGKIRKMGSDYLAYSLIDSIVDNYFIIIEKVGDSIEDLEEEVIADPESHDLISIRNSKRDIAILRKSILPLRDVVRVLLRPGTMMISKDVKFYLTDVNDHIAQITDTIETFRDVISGIVDIYLSSVNFKMNEVMKVLTIIATIFIPLTFIAGVYGMNFRHMPELDWYWGYPLLWFIMIGISVAMLWAFKRKNWF
jgi:magnesium transporter